MQCPECGATYTEADLFCGECGAVLSAPIPEGSTPQPATGEPWESAMGPEARSQDLTFEPLTEPESDVAIHLPPAPEPYHPPSYPTTAQDSRAIVAFVLGIVSLGLLVISWVPCVNVIGCFQPVVAIAAIVLGAVVRRDIDAKGGLQEDRRKAHQGMVMGIVAIAIYVVLGIVSAVLGLGLGILGEL